MTAVAASGRLQSLRALKDKTSIQHVRALAAHPCQGFDVVIFKRIQKLRNEAAEAQDWLCLYCGLPMAGPGSPHHNELAGFSELHTTAEHLRARCDGGGDHPDNVAAAHDWCNRHRHRRKRPMAHDRFAVHVRKRIAVGRWFPPVMLELLERLAPSPHSKSVSRKAAKPQRELGPFRADGPFNRG